MVSFQEFTLKEDSPIYLQIIRHIKVGLVGEIIKSGDEMPSRRRLSALLGVNPNTIQKSYKLLEEEGLIASQVGAKSFITVTEERLIQMKNELIQENVEIFIDSLHNMGLNREETLQLVEELWREHYET